MGNSNAPLQRAKRNKKDEFHTQIEDIERELVHYKDCFRDKSVLCNCNDTRSSSFWQYFSEHFDELGLRKLTAIGYDDSYLLRRL